MRFSELMLCAGLAGARRQGDTDVTDVQYDSRRCGRGSCFVAVRGWTDDGHKYISAALANGASAIVCQDPAGVPEGVAWAALDDTQAALGQLAQARHGWPARQLVNVGVTGTNGKTTIAHLLRWILEAAGHRPAMLGTISYETGMRSASANATTPDPVSLAEMMAEMVAQGRTHLVMEVSSHALHQRRVAGVDYRAAIFTNLTGDHLDYHKTMEDYLAAKRLLFEGLSADAFAIINRDDAAGESLAKATAAHVTWYGLSPAADLRGRINRIDAMGSHFDVIRHGREIAVDSPLIGRHNVFNCLAAAGACEALGIELEQSLQVLGSTRCVPGRLEVVPVDAPYRIFVDYAHTDDALANVLGALRPVARGKVILVFGCGGDRDRTKRPRMAKVAQDLADRIVVTSDNPRSEEPQAILDEILAGFSSEGRSRVEVHVDRRQAIERAIAQAGEGDIVLIAGKGHEKYQIIGGQRHHFDDVETAAQIVQARQEAQA